MEVKDPPYRKKVYDLLSQNFSDFKRTEEEFNAKLDSDPAYAEQVYGVLSQNFADFKRPKDEFLGMLGKPQAPPPQAPTPVGGGGALPIGQATSSALQQPPIERESSTVKPPSGVDRGVLFRNYWNAEGQARNLNEKFRQAQENASSIKGLGGLQLRQDAEIGRLASLQSTYAKAARSSKDIFDRELDATVKEVASAIPMTMDREGIDYADPIKIMGIAKVVAAKHGIQDPEFEKLVYDRLLAHVDTGIIEKDAERRFEEKAKSVMDANQVRMRDMFKADSVEYAKAKSFIDASVVLAKAGAKQEIDAVSGALKQQADVINASLEQARQQYEQQATRVQQAASSGVMPPDQAQQQLDALYQAYQEHFGNAQADIGGLNAKAASEVRSINQRYNRRFQEEQRRILEGAERRIDAAAERFTTEYGNTPEGMDVRNRLRDLQGEAWAEAAEARGKKIEAVSDARFMKQSLYGNVLHAMSTRFGESVVEGLGGAFKGIASSTGDQSLYLLGEEMQRAFVLPETKSDSFSDLLDAQNLAQSTGQLVGGMLPSLAASTAAAVATGGASVPVQMLASGAAGWGAETLDISGRARDDAYRNTGSRERADDAGWKSFVGQVQLLPAYSFDGLPFVGKALDFIPTKVLRMGAAAGTEYGTELIQEIPQSIAEQNILQGKDAYDDFWQGLSSMEESGDLKKLLVTMAPISLLGAGGQVAKKSQKQALEDSVKAYMAKADLSPYVEGAAGQWINRMIAERGRNFSSAVIASMQEGGQIDEARATELVKQQEQVIRAREESRVIGLGKKDTDIYTALSLQMNALRERAESEQSPAAKAVADKRAKEIERSLADFANEGKRQYVEVEFADGTSLLMDRSAAMRALKDPRFIVQSAMQGDVMSIDFQGDGMESIVADFQGAVMNVADEIESIKNLPESERLNQNRKAKNEDGTSQVGTELTRAASLPPQIPIADDVDPEVRDKMIRARESLGVRYDPLDDLPEKVIRMFDRIEADKPVDAFALDEVSDWLYAKYKEVVKMRADPKRLLTIEQIDSYAESLGEAITTVENYKTKLKEDAAADPEKAKPEGAPTVVAVAEEPPKRKRRAKDKRQPRIKINGAEIGAEAVTEQPTVVEAPTESPVRLEVTPQPTIEQQPTEVEDESRGNSLAENTSESGDMGLGNEGRATGAEAPADQSEATGVPPEAGAVEPPRSTTITQLTEEVPDNPEDLANAYLSDHYDYNDQGNKDVVLSQLTKGRVSRSSYLRFGDRNNIAQGFAKFYLRNKGWGIDQIAQEATDMLGYEVTPDDVVEYMHNNPDGRRIQSPRMVELNARYGELTGKKLNTLVARAILKNSKNNPIAVASALTGIDEDALQISEEESELWANMSDDEKRSIWEEREQAIAELEAADQAAGEGGDVVLGSEEAIQPLSAKSLQEAFGYTPEVAQATEAIADAMGLDKSKIKVVRGGRAGENALFQEQVDGWYSRLDQAVSSKGSTMPASQWKTWMESRAKDGMMSMEEAKWTGLSDFLASKGNEKVTPQQVREFLKENRVTVEVKDSRDIGGKKPDWRGIGGNLEELHLDGEPTGWAAEEGDRGTMVHRVFDDGSTESAEEFRTRAEAEDYIAQQTGNAGVNHTKFSQYQLPGASNYREVLVTLPQKTVDLSEFDANLIEQDDMGLGLWQVVRDGRFVGNAVHSYSKENAIQTAVNRMSRENKEGFRSSHFDEPNILVHLRLNDRTGPNGEKVLFIEELQSDWGQSKRSGKDVPDAPFITSTDAWVELGLKQAIRMAVDGGYDKVAWTTGDQQNERYDLSKQVESISWKRSADGKLVTVSAPQGDYGLIVNSDGIVHDTVDDGAFEDEVKGKRLDEVVGKDIADKIMSEESGDLSGDGLKVGGSGMKGFYDKILPITAGKVGKKLGGDGVVRDTGIVRGESRWEVVDNYGAPYWTSASREEAEAYAKKTNGTVRRPKPDFVQQSIAITPEMKAKVSSGVPLMQDAKGAVEFAEGGEAIIRALENPDASTGIHELAHVARRFLFDKNIPHDQRKGITDDHIKTAEQWSGAKDGNWTREAEEKFARGFERYMRDGNAPNEALRDVFAKFAQWLQSIYKKLKGSTVDIEVSAEMRKVFDSLISRGQSSDFRRKDAKPVTEITELSKRTDPKGKPLEVEYSVPGFEEYPTVAYREAGGWEVAIRGTGANVPTGGAHPTPRLAISSAAEAMRRAGKEKLDKAISKAMDQQSSLADRIEKAADELEKKLRGMAGSFPVPPTVLVSAMRAAAKVVRAGESFAKAVKAAIEDMRASKWWKTLSPADQRSAEREVREQLRVALEPKEPKPAVKKTDVKKVVDRETGVRPEKKEVTVDVRKALKDQIRLEARAAREAKADVRTKQKDFAARIREALKNELYGRLKPRQAEVIIGRAAATNPDNPRAVQRFFDYASKVIADANYAEDLGVAKDLVRKARKLSRNKGIPVNLAEILQGIAMVDVSMVDDLPTFASMVGGFLRSFDRVANGKYEMGDVRAMRKYLRGVETQVQKAKDQMLKDELEDLDINSGDLHDAILKDELEEYLSTLDEDNVSMVREHLTSLAVGAKEDLSMVDTSSMSKEDKAVIDAMKTVDLTMLSDAQLADYVFFADNITVNESLDGIGQAAAMVMGVNMAKETAEITGEAGVRTTWPTMNMRGLDMREAVRTLYYGMPNAFARIAGFAHALGDITEAMGDTNIRMGRSSADASLNKEANALNEFLKQQAQKGNKAGREPESTRNKLMEGVVGFVMQRVPRYDAQESFEINRDLIAQDIKNVKEGAEKLGKKKGLSREYETIEELYDTYLKDAASLEDVMKAFKKDMPENAAVVQYLIDMQGRYADEVLSHNRRFRNQADEKQPNYLPKTYIKSEYATKDQGAIIDGDVKKTGYEKIAEKLVKPYQSGTLKQRTSNRKLRAGTRIDYNLRRNNVQALGENLYDARTSQYWMAIREMFRTEGIANALGGERNARFMQKKAAELYEAQVRKGIKPILNEDIEKWLDRASDDVKRYASFLGLAGFWQFAQQASDQLVNTIGMSSRNKKMARRMFQSMGDVYLRNSNGLSDLLELGSIGERARLMAGTRWDTELESQMRRVEKAIGSGNLKAIQDAQEFMADKMFVALRTSDVFNATTQWVQYYKDYLDSKGESVSDWTDEAKKVMEGDKVRRRAFAYAENKTDLTQGPSDPTRFAPIGRKSSNVIANVVRTATTAFIAFPSSQYARIMQAASEVVSDLPAERKKEAFRILTSTAASIATFHGTRHILRPLAIYGMAQVIKGAAEGLLGDDDDEKALAVLALVSEAAFLAKMNDRDFNKAIEEAYKQERKERLLSGEYDAAVELRKRLTDNMKMWYTSAITDLTAGGLPEGVGKFEADMMNRVGYSIAVMSKDPSVMTKAGSLIPFDKWSKDPSNTPFPYYGQWSKEADWGMFSMVPDRVNIFMDKFDALYRDKMEEGGAAYEKEIRPEFRTRFYDRADKLKEFLLTKDEKGLKEYVKTLDPKQRAGALKAFYKAKAMPNVDPWYHVVAGEPDPRARALAYWSVYSEASPEERKKMDDIANRLRIRRSETARYLKELEAGTYRGSPEK